jgi:hypothetical protein
VLDVEKTYIVKKDTATVTWKLVNKSKNHIEFTFAVNIFLVFAGDDDAFVRFFTCRKNYQPATDNAGTEPPSEEIFERIPFTDNQRSLRLEKAEVIHFQDIQNETVINLSFDKPPLLCAGPIERSPGKPYQGTVLAAFNKVELLPNGRETLELKLKFT